jgi:hypothetical protein
MMYIYMYNNMNININMDTSINLNKQIFFYLLIVNFFCGDSTE